MRGEGRDMVPASFPVPYDSLQLVEDEDLYLANPVSMDVEGPQEGGDFQVLWVADVIAGMILGFDGSGAVIRQFGSRGSGPNEFEALYGVLGVPKGLIAGDMRRRELKLFDPDEGELLNLISHGDGRIGRSRPIRPPSEDEPGWLVSMMLASEQSPLATLSFESGELNPLGRLPEPYRRSLGAYRGFAMYFSHTYAEPLSPDSLLLAYGGVTDLEVYRISTGEQTLVGRVPERFRKGQPADLWRSFDVREEFGEGLPHDWASVTEGMWVTSDGRIVVVHIDDDFAEDPPPLALYATAYLTVLYPERDAACVDLVLPFQEEIRPIFTFGGDTLFGLERRLTEGLESEIWLLKLPIPEWDECPEVHRAHGWQVGDEEA